MMRLISLVLLASWIALMDYSAYAEPLSLNDPIYVDIESNALKPFFEALQRGDVSSLLKLISGEMYKNNRVLLEQNKQYPEFLRNYYNGVKFKVEKAEKMSEDVVVEIVVEFPNGIQRTMKLQLSGDTNKQNTSGHMFDWKIIKSEEK